MTGDSEAHLSDLRLGRLASGRAHVANNPWPAQPIPRFQRKLIRRPAGIAALALFLCVAIYAVLLTGAELLLNAEWAWIAPKFWRLGHAAYLTVMAVLISWAGTAVCRVLKGRELLLVAGFFVFSILLCGYALNRMTTGANSLWGLEPPAGPRRVLIYFGLANAAYALGCWRARARRTARTARA